MSEDKMLTNSNEINEIVVSNPIGDELSLEKVTDDKLEAKKKYKEVFVSDLSLMMGNVSQTALQVANQGMTLAQIAKQAPNGLFTATVNPATLSKFANRTTTTMVRDSSGHLVEHAGFAEVGLRASMNPAIYLSAGMQVMSAVSGTYYLKEINDQITDMDAKLEELLNIHHDTNIGRLIAARKGLSEIANREFVDTTDLSTIRNYKKTADEIHEEYIYRLKRQESEDKKLSDINFTILIAFEANKLSLFAELIEIGTRMKIGGQIDIINGLTSQLKQNYANSFYHNNELEVKKIYSMIQQRSINELVDKNIKFEKSLDKLTDDYISTGWGILPEIGIRTFFAGKAKRNVNKAKEKVVLEKKNLSTVKKGMKQNKESDGIDNIIDEVVKLQYKETEILYIPTENNKQRVFVPIEDE
ncbi:hypothetical protein DFO73_101605 [Cytobacillus oceanisediminis]|uniref:Uncharacterized protein n=1 Tax=Cytobacillus oceanisediminis TaxID=665099 RepID=A0A2V3A841_9BACI|nr:hypothetical protein [Cytobacillus oceanisediminis]PWW32341.1 hypothetical protein DFO73_101605 [Cytobacillus oceanisediminis]